MGQLETASEDANLEQGTRNPKDAPHVLLNLSTSSAKYSITGMPFYGESYQVMMEIRHAPSNAARSVQTTFLM
jgi:hypothetical protein